MSEYQSLSITKEEGITTLTMNSMVLGSLETYELAWALRVLQSDMDTDAVIITGRKNVFMSGADLHTVGDMNSYHVAESFLRIAGTLWKIICNFQKLLISAINGYCLGGGLELALACDYRISVDKVKNIDGNSVPFIGFPETGMGIVPLLGGSQTLPHMLGLAAAKLLVLSAELISAQEAYRIGLINRITAVNKLLSEAKEFARMAQDSSASAISSSKKLINNGLFALTFEECRNAELLAQTKLKETANQNSYRI